MTVGERITELREIKGLSINKLAYKAAMSSTHLRDIERNIKKPTVPTLEKICDELGISLHDFFSYTSDKDLLEDPFLRKYYKLTKEQQKALEIMLTAFLND